MERTRKRRSMIKLILATAFVGVIVAANYVTSAYGMVPVGFGLTATAGTYLAGISFVLRDTIQDLTGRVIVIALIIVGAVVSFLLSVPAIALASGVAFLLSELADLAVYTPLRRRGYIRAAVASNIAGAFVDSLIFLTIAGFPVWSSIPGQMIGKLAITLVAVAAVWTVRLALLRKSVRA